MKSIEKEIKRIQKLLNDTHTISEEVDKETQRVFENYEISNKAYEKLEKICPSLWLKVGSHTSGKIQLAEEILYHLQKQIKEDKEYKTLKKHQKKDFHLKK